MCIPHVKHCTFPVLSLQAINSNCQYSTGTGDLVLVESKTQLAQIKFYIYLYFLQLNLYHNFVIVRSHLRHLLPSRKWS